jgi:hypothetical protein
MDWTGKILFGFLLIIAMFLASPAHAERANCYVSIDGEAYLTGPCEFRTNSSSILFMSVADSITFDGNQIDMVVNVTPSARTASITYLTWKDLEVVRMRFDLGAVTPLDACWVNDRVRICAWPLHEHPEQAEPPAQ